MSSKCLGAALAVLLVSSVFAAHAQAVTIDLVPVGNPGNPGELSGSGVGSCGEDAIVGSVDYEYWIGKYEVTAGQYCEFLNAVARTDTYGLYSEYMPSAGSGCKIERSGSSGSYVYSVPAFYANRPVNYVSWGSAARFCNWLQNGQPIGDQDLTTTEDGAYYLNGATDHETLAAVSRKAGWRWAIPTEDEWYKAAYHKNDGPTGNYWDYATSSDRIPSNKVVEPDPGNSATYDAWGTTEVGQYESSSSPYGTFDQCGNVREWTETMKSYPFRYVRGGSFLGDEYSIRASWRCAGMLSGYPTFDTGFRVVSIPEPGCVCLLISGLAAGLGWRQRR